MFTATDFSNVRHLQPTDPLTVTFNVSLPTGSFVCLQTVSPHFDKLPHPLCFHLISPLLFAAISLVSTLILKPGCAHKHLESFKKPDAQAPAPDILIQLV